MSLLPPLLTHSVARPSGQVVVRFVEYAYATNVVDPYDAGTYSVFGTVAIAGPPETFVVRRVRLICRETGRFVRETWSDPAGNYRFDNIRQGPWTVLSHDFTGIFNAVVADNILGTPI